ncbi:MAG: tRNA dihydrouridine synthase DusB [Odoribacteraceae bacterium]|jgi:nifR3 family TIM-barrel protein|nr:tRNA dihydrouridine synthase DusB [Odoribacteraceae bacterium]
MLIGNKEIGDRPVILAPMEEVTNKQFRAACKSFGADWLYSEFVSADALVRSVRKTVEKLEVSDEERPVSIQIYGKEVETMVEAAKIAESVSPDFIDLNFGCPVKRVAAKGAGAGMLRDIPRMIAIAGAVVKAVRVPVTAKTRLGWDETRLLVSDVAERLQDAGIAAIAVHGRFRSQMYKGQADWGPIADLKLNPRLRVPIIGNGDIDSPEKAAEAFEKYGVDGVMIGRAAIGRPWIFQQVKRYILHRELLPDPPLADQVDVLLQQVARSCEWLGETRGILHSRRHLARAFKGIPNFRESRVEILRAPTLDRLAALLEQVKHLRPEERAVSSE